VDRGVGVIPSKPNKEPSPRDKRSECVGTASWSTVGSTFETTGKLDVSDDRLLRVRAASDSFSFFWLPALDLGSAVVDATLLFLLEPAFESLSAAETEDLLFLLDEALDCDAEEARSSSSCANNALERLTPRVCAEAGETGGLEEEDEVDEGFHEDEPVVDAARSNVPDTLPSLVLVPALDFDEEPELSRDRVEDEADGVDTSLLDEPEREELDNAEEEDNEDVPVEIFLAVFCSACSSNFEKSFVVDCR
jgi:hypothetical protein